MSEEFEVTTADMLEIGAGGGNGVEYVDVNGLIEKAAKELRDKDARIAKLEAALKPFADANQFIIMFGVQWVKATEDDFRNARAALKGEK
jgi:hypothetical protein